MVSVSGRGNTEKGYVTKTKNWLGKAFGGRNNSKRAVGKSVFQGETITFAKK